MENNDTVQGEKLQWVKANERMPISNTTMPLKVNGQPFVGYLSVNGSFYINELHYKYQHPNNVEWLEEIPNELLKGDKQGEKEMTAKNFLKEKGLKDTLYNVNYNPNQNRGLPESEWIKGGLSNLLEEYANHFKSQLKDIGR